MNGKNSTPSILKRDGERLIESLDPDKIGYRLQYLGEIDGERIYFEAPTERYFVIKDGTMVPYIPPGNLD